VTLGSPLAPGSPKPTLAPSIAGTWTVVGDSEMFAPATTLAPCSTYTLTVWGQTTSTSHAPLGRRRRVQVRVGCPPIAGLQQALARLGYLSATFRPARGVHIRATTESRREAAIHSYHAVRGTLVPLAPGAPPVQLGRLDTTTRGALSVYQEQRGLPATGEPDSATWESLLYTLTHYRRNPVPYTWVTVSESLPETLLVHRGRRVALSTPVNTGVPGAETQRGIFAIYARYVSTSMSGTDPNGTHYDVPDVPWVNYFNGGDAVHGYPRASYGWPQSNGCVELPIETARSVFGMLTLGDIVEVY